MNAPMNVAGMAMSGIQAEQGPPLSIPASYFLTAPLALLAAAAFIIVHSDTILISRLVPATVALAHLGTIGFLTMVMLGALYQMIPVVAGVPVPWPRLAHLVHLCLLGGLVALLVALLTGTPLAYIVAAFLVGAAFTLFLLPTIWALVLAPTKTDPVRGIRLAIAGLLSLVSLGLVMAVSRGSGTPLSSWVSLQQAHIAIAFTVWIGGLISAVSWQVLPMFYVTPDFSSFSKTLGLALIALALILPITVLVIGLPPQWVLYAALPGAFNAWLYHPVQAFRVLRQRKRKRRDGSYRFWLAGLACGPLAFAAGLLSVGSDDLRWPILFGWLVLWGWAGLIVHGMLTRIVSFLVWFHRLSPLIGRVPVPAMRQLWPNSRVEVGLWMHLASLLLGVVAIVVGHWLAAVAMGLSLAVTAAWLGLHLLKVVRFRAPTVPAAD